ncbi:hypothetical protein AMTR_s00173p00010570 [Amborella trichopoda]|uniref:Protein FAR1-RELATED SEQUENCE n=1 Tax=Amborella trichopoda TaxID=13333 RepID=W1NPB7_AMBTC|nr:hypothetical protein AMTR_s00173p00010570 [Amborella trichopoda]
MKIVLKIPSNYILSRWTLEAKKGVKDKCGGLSSTSSKFLRFIRHHELHDIVRTIAEPALESDVLFEKVKLGLCKLVEDVNATREHLSNILAPSPSTHYSVAEDEVYGYNRSVDASPLVLDPLCVRTIGRPKTKMRKPSWDKGQKTSLQKTQLKEKPHTGRKCKVYNKSGHNRCNCPVRASGM